MKTKMLTALLSSLFLAILACPVLAAPIDMLVAGYGLDASAIPTTFDAETVLGWWLSDGFVTHPLGALFVFLLALCACALIAYSSALKSRAEDGGVLGDAHVKTGREVVKGSMTWGGSTNPSSRGFVYGFTKYRGKTLPLPPLNRPAQLRRRLQRLRARDPRRLRREERAHRAHGR